MKASLSRERRLLLKEYSTFYETLKRRFDAWWAGGDITLLTIQPHIGSPPRVDYVWVFAISYFPRLVSTNSR
jgi:hypothetical protein